MKVSVVGVAWYRPENFDRLRALFEDGDKLHRTYAEWLRAAEGACQVQERLGVRVVRVDIDPDEFPEWCRAEGKKVDARARMDYANLVAYRVAAGTWK